MPPTNQPSAEERIGYLMEVDPGAGDYTVKTVVNQPSAENVERAKELALRHFECIDFQFEKSLMNDIAQALQAVEDESRKATLRNVAEALRKLLALKVAPGPPETVFERFMDALEKDITQIVMEAERRGAVRELRRLAGQVGNQFTGTRRYSTPDLIARANELEAATKETGVGE